MVKISIKFLFTFVNFLYFLTNNNLVISFNLSLFTKQNIILSLCYHLLCLKKIIILVKMCFCAIIDLNTFILVLYLCFLRSCMQVPISCEIFNILTSSCSLYGQPTNLKVNQICTLYTHKLTN
jgi:hypothetical protein